MKGGIYRIINLVTEKYYIGSAINFSNRKKHHFYHLRNGIHHNPHLQNSFKKYGEKIFVFDIIEYCGKEKLIEREQFWIDSYKTRGEILYNIRIDATNNFGLKRSKETKEKISKSHKGKPLSEETKRKISEANKGKLNYWLGKKKPHSEDTKLKISLAKKGKPSNRLGVILSEETKQKMRNKIPWNKGLKLVKVAS